MAEVWVSDRGRAGFHSVGSTRLAGEIDPIRMDLGCRRSPLLESFDHGCGWLPLLVMVVVKYGSVFIIFVQRNPQFPFIKTHILNNKIP